jgi:hypothetical protein
MINNKEEAQDNLIITKIKCVTKETKIYLAQLKKLKILRATITQMKTLE